MENPNILNGSCLCRKIKFSFEGPVEIISKCYCSLCRKSSGTEAGSVVVIPKEKLTWISGESYSKKLIVTTSTAKEDRQVIICTQCGSRLPDSYGGEYIFIPTGLIDDYFQPKIIVNHHLSSKGWELPQKILNYEEDINFEEMDNTLKSLQVK